MVSIFKVLIILTAILFTNLLHAQVSGKVLDSISGAPISSFSVVVFAISDSNRVMESQTTDSLGSYNFSAILTEQILLRFSHVAYKTKTLKLNLKDSNAIKNVRIIYLELAGGSMENVMVKSERRSIRMEDGNTVLQVAGNKDLKTAMNMFDVLKNTPGVLVGANESIQVGNNVTPTFFINGKPILMNNEELNNYLKSLGPDKVSSIEVITNPGARYDGEYKGIIDIRLKTNDSNSWGGSYNNLLERNKYTRSNQSLNLFYNYRKFSFTTNTTYLWGSDDYRYRTYQHLANGDILETKLRQKNKSQNPGVQLGIGFQADSSNRFGVLLRYHNIDNERDRVGSLYASNSDGNEVSISSKSDNPTHFGHRTLGASIDYSFQRKNFNISFLGNLLNVVNTQQDEFINMDQLLQAKSQHWNTDLLNRINIKTAQLDFSQKVNTWTIEGGVKISRSVTDNDLKYDTLDMASQKFVPDASRSNIFLYDEKINAGYLSARGKIGGVSLNAGLRAEHTLSLSNSVTLGSEVEKSYLKWLPSFVLSYPINKQQDISISYAHRVTRPPFSQLNPFRFYFSPLNYWIGNPHLKPSTTAQLKLNYRYKSYLLELNAGKEFDVITRYPMYDRITNEMAFLGTNLPEKKFANISLSVPVKINRIWNLNLQTLGYYSKDQMPYLDKVYNPDVYYYAVRLNQTFTFRKDFSMNLYANYQSKSASSLYFFKPMYNVDMAVQKGWFNNKLNVKLAVTDIFDTYYQQFYFRYPEIINNQLSHWWGQQRAQLSISYTFGKSNKNARNTTVSEEESRTR